MPLLVQKYGGSSIRGPERIRSVAARIARTVRQGRQVVVAVSAMGDETDQLLRLAPAVSSVHPARELDMLVTAGERKAAALLCLALQDLGVPGESFTGTQAGIITDTSHMEAHVVEVRPDRIRQTLEAGRVPVVGGAQGVSLEGDVTFLGRGGTDTTAVALAAALGASECEIYTDVEGIFSGDPRLIPYARLLRRISFSEMLAMCAAGCPKPAERAVLYARERLIRLHVRSAFASEPGTLIDKTAREGSRAVSAVVVDRAQAAVRVPGIERAEAAQTARGLLADASVQFETIVADGPENGASEVAFVFLRDRLEAVCGALKGTDGLRAQPEMAKVSIVGPGVTDHPGVEARMAEALSRAQVRFELLPPAQLRRSCLVERDDAERAAIELHRAFGLDARHPSPHVHGDGRAQGRPVGRPRREFRSAEGCPSGN